MFEALYSQDIGLCGFRCRVGECTRVVRTYRGIVMHCKRVHGLVAQRELFDAAPIVVKEKKDGEAKATKKPKLVRAVTVRSTKRTDRDALELFAGGEE